MEILEKLKNDPEIKQLKEEWGNKTSSPFPIYHFNLYLGIEDYKKKIRAKLKEL